MFVRHGVLGNPGEYVQNLVSMKENQNQSGIGIDVGLLMVLRTVALERDMIIIKNKNNSVIQTNSAQLLVNGSFGVIGVSVIQIVNKESDFKEGLIMKT